MCLADLYCDEPLPGVLVFPSAPARGAMEFRLSPAQRFATAPQLNEWICTTGWWHAESGSWPVFSPHREHCRIVAGTLKLTDLRARSWNLNPGDSFLLLPGFSGNLEVLSPTQVVYTSFAWPGAIALLGCESGPACTALGQQPQLLE
jgi:uncharacterized protein